MLGMSWENSSTNSTISSITCGIETTFRGRRLARLPPQEKPVGSRTTRFSEKESQFVGLFTPVCRLIPVLYWKSDSEKVGRLNKLHADLAERVVFLPALPNHSKLGPIVAGLHPQF